MFITEKEAIELLGCSPDTINTMRLNGFFKGQWEKRSDGFYYGKEICEKIRSAIDKSIELLNA